MMKWISTISNNNNNNSSNNKSINSIYIQNQEGYDVSSQLREVVGFEMSVDLEGAEGMRTVSLPLSLTSHVLWDIDPQLLCRTLVSIVNVR